jgi:hypothetical protein
MAGISNIGLDAQKYKIAHFIAEIIVNFWPKIVP